MARIDLSGIRERLDGLRDRVAPAVAPLVARLDALSPRDRTALSIGAAAIAVTILGLISYSAAASISDLEERVAQKTEQLQEVLSLTDSYTRSKQETERLQARLKSLDKGFQLFSFLEEQAKQARLELTDIVDRGPVGNREGVLVEHRVKVTLEKITLDRLLDFLYRIEHAGYLLKVRTLRARARGTGEDRILNVTFAVATYKVGRKKRPDRARSRGR